MNTNKYVSVRDWCIPTSYFAWEEVGDLDLNQVAPDIPVFTDSRGRNFVLGQYCQNSNGGYDLFQIKTHDVSRDP